MTNKKHLRIGIVGATGLMGQELLTVLTELDLPIGDIHLAASKSSVGEEIECMGKSYPVVALTPDFFENMNLCFFYATPEVSEQFVPIALDRGCYVIDQNELIGDEFQTMVVPEVNVRALDREDSRYVRNPSSISIPLSIVLSPLSKAYQIEEVFVATYQSVSTRGQRGIEELTRQITGMLNYHEVESDVFPQRIAFNLIPNMGGLSEDGDSWEELRVAKELRSMLQSNTLNAHVHMVQVPTYIGAGMAVTVRCKEDMTVDDVRAVLSESEGVKFIDAPSKQTYPVLLDVQGQDEVLVGRIRVPSVQPNVLSFWVVNDNLKKGSTLNSAQIAKHIVDRFFS
ncbi:MAG: aspartate-semialdehyde dehydrogenase [Bdellovibrionota bacterium]